MIKRPGKKSKGQNKLLAEQAWLRDKKCIGRFWEVIMGSHEAEENNCCMVHTKPRKPVQNDDQKTRGVHEAQRQSHASAECMGTGSAIQGTVAREAGGESRGVWVAFKFEGI